MESKGEIRDHMEIMFDGRWIFWRGKRDWTMRFHKPEVARKMFLNLEETKAFPGEWIIAKFRPREEVYPNGS